MSRALVVDASVAAMWVLPEPGAERALERAAQWADEGIHVVAPCFLLAELTNALYRRVARREATLEEMIEALDVALGFGIELREEPELAVRAMELAGALGQPTTYDCHYLALAERYEAELWTGDRRFFNAVHEAHPRVRWVSAGD
jgi:predicted nucleic acid-binding protein